jgi:hypothetical protein
MSILTRAAAFSFSVFAVFTVAGAIAVYGFSYFESAYGRGGSFQVYVWIAIAAAVLCALTSSFGFLWAESRKRLPSLPVASVLGGALALSSIGLLFAVDGGFLHAVGLPGMALWVLVAAPFFAFLGSKALVKSHVDG